MTKESDTGIIYGLPLTIYESQIEAAMKAIQLFGHTRDRVRNRHAVPTPPGFVASCLSDAPADADWHPVQAGGLIWNKDVNCVL